MKYHSLKIRISPPDEIEVKNIAHEVCSKNVGKEWSEELEQKILNEFADKLLQKVTITTF